MNHRILTIVILFAFIMGCQTEKQNFPDHQEIFGLAGIIDLNPGETEILLDDYFINSGRIDSVYIEDSGIKADLNNDVVIIPSLPANAPFLSELKIWCKGYAYSLLLRKSRKIAHVYKYDPNGRSFNTVQLAGEINGWNPKATNLKYKDGVWQIQLLLNPGRYQYQLVIDGNWMLDPANPESVDNNIGGFNSLLKIGEDNQNQRPLLYTKSFEGMKIDIGIENTIDEVFVLWDNFRLHNETYLLSDDHLTVSIPEAATLFDRSFIRVLAANPSGVSNDLLIPLKNGKVIAGVDELDRNDWQGAIMYFLMVDRFNNGKKENDFPVDDPSILPQANHHGGDLAGVTQKIRDGYFSDLGINTIWLSPITQNPEGAFGFWPDPESRFSGYHGYWPVSSTKVDYRFGTDTEFRELIETAHQNNLNVILDYVANHVHQEHPVYQEHPDWATDLYLPDGTENTQKWDEYRLTTWFDTFLPTLDLSRPDVVEPMTDSAVFWIKEYGLDGFRHDATKHIPEIFWRTLTRKLKSQVMIPQNKKIYQVGETYGNRELIGSYVSSGQLDAQFDFNVYDDAIAVFARDKEPFTKLSNSLNESLEYYGYHNLMGYITGNQDRGRFISYAGGSLKFEEDAKLAGWTREIEVGDPVGYKKLSALTAFMMTIPGIPTIYYGDEFGMPGGNDPDNRRMMRFGDLSEEETVTRNITKKLIHLRTHDMPFIYGDIQMLKVSDDVFAYSRNYFDKTAIVVFNKAKQSKKITIDIPDGLNTADLKSQFDSKWILEKGTLVVDLGSWTFDIFAN